jgi:hypothetical protein
MLCVLYRCCKSRSECCKSYNGVSGVCSKCFICLQMYVASVLSRCCIYMHVAIICFKCFVRIPSVLSKCCICFAIATHIFFWCFRRMLQVFQLFSNYISRISSKYCKNRFDVAYVVVRPTATTACYRCWAHVYARGSGGGASGKRGKRKQGADRDVVHAWVRRHEKGAAQAP